MMELSKKLVIASTLCSLILSSKFLVSSATGLKELSIYNLYSGALIYSYYDTSKQWILSDSAYSLSGSDYPARSTWNIIYNHDKSISFRNKRTQLCLSYFSDRSALKQEMCDQNDEKQQFKIELVPSGAYMLISMKNSDQCLYSPKPDSVSSELCARNCETCVRFHWALIPPPY